MSQAWLLNLGSDCVAAVSMGELVHLLYSPPLVAVPCTPSHASHVLDWNGALLPLIDLPRWLRGVPGDGDLSVVGVIASQRDGQAQPEYAAVRLAAPPVRIQVEDAQTCPLPEPVESWQVIALACFEHEGRPVPILDTERLTREALPTLSE